MKLTLRYFASIREGLGLSVEEWQTQASTLRLLRKELAARSDAYETHLGEQRVVRMAVNQVMANSDDAPITDGAEVAFFPPVTGG